jgi:hypothetical protein
MMSTTLSFVDERQFLSVIQSVPTPAESTGTESPSVDPVVADPILAESSPTNPALAQR